MIRLGGVAAASVVLAACTTTAHRPPPAPMGTAASVPAPTAPALNGPAAHDPAALFTGTALSMLGHPYRYGGADPGGFDCSGLVAYSAAAAGIRVPRTAHEQLNVGTPVSRAELAPGDLVFMHLQSKELHVAIALDRQRFIHAPSSGGRVRIDSLAAAPYSDGFLAARRVILRTATGVSSPPSPQP